MGKAVFECNTPFLSQPFPAAVVVCRSEHGLLHSGVLYRAKKGDAAVLHLGWENHLYNTWNELRLWAVPDTEDPRRVRHIGALCRLIWKRFTESKVFPYAIPFSSQSSFDLDTGDLIPGPGCVGLTCSTFVLAVFQSMYVTLIDDEWPVRQEEDRAFLKRLREITGPKFDRLHAQLEAQVEAGCKRVQPQEVIGACGSCDLPAKFEACYEFGQQVIQMLSPPPDCCPASTDGATAAQS